LLILKPSHLSTWPCYLVFNTVLYYESTPSTFFCAYTTGGYSGFSPIEGLHIEGCASA
jgi:hypothetical protein